MVVKTRDILLISNRQRSGMLSNIPQYTGQPITIKNYSVQNVGSIFVENPYSYTFVICVTKEIVAVTKTCLGIFVAEKPTGLYERRKKNRFFDTYKPFFKLGIDSLK